MDVASEKSPNNSPGGVRAGDTAGAATISSAGNEDQPASLKEDMLGFAPYVEAVLSFLKHPDTRPPFTLSIEGEWGSGKSSFMLQLRQSLETNGHKTVSFNAWRHDKVESMWAAFALHFIQELSASLSWWTRLRSNLRLVWMRFNFLRAWPTLAVSVVLLVLYFLLIGKLWQVGLNLGQLFTSNGGINWPEMFKASGWIGALTALLFILKKVAEVTGNPLQVDLQKFSETPKYSGYTSFIEEFHRDFRKAVDILAGKQEKIFVFVDDLDRADVPKAAELMQGLNLMITDSPKLIFIIGMDREKVAAGIAAKYKDLLKFLNPNQASLDTAGGLRQAREFGYDFLEKFIQLSFKIPQPSVHTLEDFIRSLSHADPIENALESEIKYNPVLTVEDGKDSAAFQEVARLVAPFFEFNPRRIKQFVNTFRLKAHIAHSTGLFGVPDDSEYKSLTIPQLGKFVAITQKWPAITDDLLVRPDLFRAILVGNIEYDVFGWHHIESFMNLLQLESRNGTSGAFEYQMQGVNVSKLLETSPAVQAKISAQSSTYKFSEEAPAAKEQTAPPATERPIRPKERAVPPREARATPSVADSAKPSASKSGPPRSKNAK